MILTTRDVGVGLLGLVAGAIITLILQRYVVDHLTLVTLLLVFATLALAGVTAMHAEATRVATFIEAALSLYSLLEQASARSDRKTVYEQATNLTGQQIAEKSDLREVVDRVAASFDYLNDLAEGDDRLRGLAIRFYGAPAIRSWAVIRHYVKHMIEKERRPPNFHQAFRKFAEAAARHREIGSLHGIGWGHKVRMDLGDENIVTLSIFDESDMQQPG